MGLFDVDETWDELMMYDDMLKIKSQVDRKLLSGKFEPLDILRWVVLTKTGESYFVYDFISYNQYDYDYDGPNLVPDKSVNKVATIEKVCEYLNDPKHPPYFIVPQITNNLEIMTRLKEHYGECFEYFKKCKIKLE